MSETVRRTVGWAWLRRRRRCQAAEPAENASPVPANAPIAAEEIAAGLTGIQPDLGEMTAVAIEMLDLVGRSRRSG